MLAWRSPQLPEIVAEADAEDAVLEKALIKKGLRPEFAEVPAFRVSGPSALHWARTRAGRRAVAED